MHAIIDSFPVLLQLSVFFFYVGLAESIHSVPTLFATIVTFAGTMVTLYLVTLIPGAFSPSCPFKSPITSLPYKGAQIIGFAWKALLGTITLITFAILAPAFSRSLWREKSRLVIDGWVLVRSFWHRTDLRRDEQILMNKSHGVAGVVFWWIQELEMGGAPNEVKINPVAKVAESLPVDAALSMGTWRGGFGDWCFRVFMALEAESPAKSALLEADAVCHLMHQSPKAVQAVRYGLAEYERHSAVVSDFYGYMCSSLRKGWTKLSPKPSKPATLPVLDMQPTTFAVYLRFQLQHWIHSEDPESRSNYDLLLQELPLALNPHYFSDLDQHTTSVIDAISVAAIVLVPEDTHHQITSISGLLNHKPPERLLQAFYRLSHYSNSRPPNNLVPLAVAAATRVLCSFEPAGFHQNPSWKSGKFADSLYRLLRLGRIWWYAEVEEDCKHFGSCLLYEMHLLMDVAIRQGIEACFNGHAKVLSPPLTNLQELFATYASPDAPRTRIVEHSTEAIGILDFALSLRYLVQPFPTPHRLVWSRTPSFAHNLEECPQVIRQMIHDVGIAPADSRMRRALLSVIIKGSEMFLPVPVSSLFPDLTTDIDRIAEEILLTDDFVYELSRERYATFDRWDELVSALEELLRVLGHPKTPGRALSVVETAKSE